MTPLWTTVYTAYFFYNALVCSSEIPKNSPVRRSSRSRYNRMKDGGYGQYQPREYDEIPTEPRYPNDQQYDSQYEGADYVYEEYRESDGYGQPTYNDHDDEYYAHKQAGYKSRYDDHYDQHDGEYDYDDEHGQERGGRRRREPVDKVQQYTKTFPLKLLVAFSSALAGIALTHLIINFVISRAPIYVTVPVGLACMISCFFQSDFSTFSRALGVFAIILFKQSSFTRFFKGFARQVYSIFVVSKRRAFPPSDNPWKYVPEGPQDPEFRMTSALVSVVLVGSWVGWMITSLIPLVPNFLGALAGAGSSGYLGTLTDAKGDLLRFLGYSVTEAWGAVSDAGAQVNLKAKTSVIMRRVFFITNQLDKKYKIVEKLQKALSVFISMVTKLFFRMKADMDT